MDTNTGIHEVQRSKREHRDLSDLGFVRITPINPAALSEEEIYSLWEHLSTQDYSFDDFTRGNFKLFVEGMLDPGALFFAIDSRGLIVVRNLQLSDNAYIHYAIWDPHMKFSEIIKCGREVITFLFSQVKVTRVTAAIPDYNKNASKFAIMLGFKFEGELRNACVWNEKHHNVRYYGLLHQEWINSRYEHALRTKNDQFVNNNRSTAVIG